MKKLLFVAGLMMANLSAMCQHLYTKDHVDLGKTSVFVDACIKGAKTKMLQVKGMDVDVRQYCVCMSEKMIPNMNSDELMRLANDKTLEDFLMKNDNYKVFMACLENNVNFHDTFRFRKNSQTQLTKKIAIKECVDEMQKDSTTREVFTVPQMRKYCSCAIDKLYESNLKYKDLNEIEETDNEAFNILVLPCATEALTDTSGGDPGGFSGLIIGNTSSTKVPLIRNLNNSYKVKLKLGGIIKYFTFDTGASDMMIDEKTEKELIAAGVIKPGDYLNEEEEYHLANNQVVKGRMILLNNITIGDYTLHKVTVAILKDGSLLLGKSLLDLFSRWEIQKDDNVLILYK